MPTSERYARYRADQTTVWISKTAAEFLSRERGSPGEGAAAVLDRVLNEYRKMRRASGGGGGATGGGSAAKPATKSAAKSAPKTATKAAAGTRGGARTARGAGAAKTARKPA